MDVKRGILIIGGLMFFAIMVIFFFNSELKCKISKCVVPNLYSISSENSVEFDEIKNATGYDWNRLTASQDGSGNERIAAIFFLSNELVAANEYYSFIERSYGIEEWEMLDLAYIEENDSDASIITIAENLEKINLLYENKNIGSAQTRLRRISFLKQYFSTYPVSGLVVSDQSVNHQARQLAGEFSDSSVNEYQSMLKELIRRNNLVVSR